MKILNKMGKCLCYSVQWETEYLIQVTLRQAHDRESDNLDPIPVLPITSPENMTSDLAFLSLDSLIYIMGVLKFPMAVVGINEIMYCAHTTPPLNSKLLPGHPCSHRA